MNINPLKNKFEFCSALVLGLSAFFIRNIFLYHSFLPGPKSVYGSIVRCIFIIGLVYLVLTLSKKVFLHKYKKAKKTPNIGWNKKSILICAAILFACWLPYLIVFYPCVDNWDTYNQIKDVYDGTSSDLLYNSEQVMTEKYLLGDHHPVFDTLVFGSFVVSFDKLGNQNLGYFTYALLQAIATAFALSSVVCFLSKFNTPKWFRIVSLLFFAIMPFFPLYAINMLKDSLNALLFVPYFLIYVSIALDFPIKKRHKVYFILLSVLLALTKKTFVYILILANLALLFRKKSTRKEKALFISSALLPFFTISFILGKILFPVFNIYPGERIESVGNLVQQSALVMIEHGDEISKEDKETLGKIININRLGAYNWITSDGIKHIATSDAIDSQAMGDYYLLWLRQAFRYPDVYLRADFALTGGYYVAEYKAQLYLDLHPYREAKNPDSLKPARNFVGDAYKKINKLPIIGFLFEIALYCWWIPILSLLFILKNAKDKRKFIIAFMPILIQILVMALTPLVSVRYALPIIYVTPLLIGMCFGLPTGSSRRNRS